MFSTLRTRFGIPGVISVIALVFAMFGGAYAASNSPGGGKATASKAKAKKGPRGPKGATGPAGPAGAQGPAGPAGAKGDAGANGSNGAAGATGPTGAAGAKGATGATGFSGFTDTLPKEKTETGYWSMTGAGSAGTMGTTISFPIPLAEDGEDEASGFAFTLKQTENKEFGTSGCEGTASKPTAPKGKLCVYTAIENTPVPSRFLEARSFQEGNMVFESYGATGAVLVGNQVPAGQYQEVWGTWAVTAP